MPHGGEHCQLQARHRSICSYDIDINETNLCRTRQLRANPTTYNFGRNRIHKIQHAASAEAARTLTISVFVL
jgi:hypothetical protein